MKKITHQKITKTKIKEWFQAYTFLLPAIIIAAIFFGASIIYSLYLSFNDVNLFSNTYQFVGLENYKRIFTDERALVGLKNTGIFALFVVPIQTVISLVVAYVLSNNNLKGKKIFNIIYFLPALTSSSALTLIFMFIFNVHGPINNVLISSGLIVEPINFLNDPNYALKVIMAMNIWSTIPTFMTIYLASLIDLPKSIYEAADIDGATSWQKLRYITIPYLRPITTYVLLMGIIGTFLLFEQGYFF